MTSATSVVAQGIREAVSRRGVAVLPFLPAGYPTMAATVATIAALGTLDSVGAIEIGFPFSDPIADGPVIQEAFNVALTSGLKVHDIFDAVRAARQTFGKPLVAMVSFSIVFRYGVDRFIADAKSSGFAGILIPDLPPPEAAGVCGKIRAAGLDTVLLVAPTTSPRRRPDIAAMCSGFVYYLSVSGITGERAALPDDLVANVRHLKSIAGVPVCVGFGISKREHLDQLRGVGDGAIIGSAIVRRIRELLPAQSIQSSPTAPTPQQIAEAVVEYCRTLY